MDDLISRQAAIDAINREAYRHTYIYQIINIIERLPTAQSEYTRTVFIECECYLTKDKRRAVLEDMKHEAGEDVHIVLLEPFMHVAVPCYQWIPVEAMLPDKPSMYVVTDRKGNVVVFAFYGTDSSRKFWLKYAKAWMPLPDPYTEKGVEHGKA